jgi:MoxR-like ATPase
MLLLFNQGIGKKTNSSTNFYEYVFLGHFFLDNSKDIPTHKFLLQQMLKDYLLGEHMLLLGNQGVGKNKLTDKFLQLLKIEREYIQLHRDTTVQSLLLSPSLEGIHF